MDTTLGRFLGLSPEELARELDLNLEAARRLWQEPVYHDDVVARPGDEDRQAFQWGFALGVWCERYNLAQVGRLIGLVQRRLGRSWR